MGRRRNVIERGRRERDREQRRIAAARTARKDAATAAALEKRRAKLEREAALRAAARAARAPEPAPRKRTLARGLALDLAVVAAWSGALAVIGSRFGSHPLVVVAATALAAAATAVWWRHRRGPAKAIEVKPVRVEVTPPEPPPPPEEPVLSCAECGLAIEADPATCALCIDVVHEGACAERHEGRHGARARGYR